VRLWRHAPAQLSQRHCEEHLRRSNPCLSELRDGLLRGACHRARIRATRWLAMTGLDFLYISQTAQGRTSAFSRRDPPELCVVFHPRKLQRAQGKPGARCTRGLVCKMHKRIRTRAYRFSGGIPAFPAQWFTAYSVLSPVNGLCCHRRCAGIPRNLTPASRRQDHTISPSASVPFVNGTSASTASHRTFVTIASRPSFA
jgi:hypothetical protein